MIREHCAFLYLLFILSGFLYCYDDVQPKDNAPTGQDSKYQLTSLKALEDKYREQKPRSFSPWVKGVKRRIVTHKKILALTLDACGGLGGNGYDKELISYLEKERIPATLFLSGKWIKRHRDDVIKLAGNSLFYIGNHGLNHKPASINGSFNYMIKGTASIKELYQEVNENAGLIKVYTGQLPLFYRPGTGSIDTVAANIVSDMGFITIGFTICPGDADPRLSVRTLKKYFYGTLKPGAIILLHMNRPGGKTLKLLKEVVPELRGKGYRFVQLRDYADSLK